MPETYRVLSPKEISVTALLVLLGVSFGAGMLSVVLREPLNLSAISTFFLAASIWLLVIGPSILLGIVMRLVQQGLKHQMGPHSTLAQATLTASEKVG